MISPKEIYFREKNIRNLLGNRDPKTHPILRTPSSGSTVRSLDARVHKKIKTTPPAVLDLNQLFPSGASYNMCKIGAIYDDFYANRLAYCPEKNLVASIKCYKNSNGYFSDKVILLKCSLKPFRFALVKGICFVDSKYIQSIAFHQNGQGILLGSASGENLNVFHLEFWSNQDGVWFLEKTIETNAMINCITPIRDSIFIGMADGRVAEIDAASKTILKIYEITERENKISSLTASPSKRYLAVGSEDNFVAIIDLEKKEVVTRIDSQGTSVRAVAFNPTNETQVAIGGGSLNPLLRIIDFQKEIEYFSKNYGQQFTGIFWTRDNRLISTHNSNQVYFTPVDPKQPLNMVGSQKPIVIGRDAEQRNAYPIFDSRPNGDSQLFMVQGNRIYSETARGNDQVIQLKVIESYVDHSKFDRLPEMMDISARANPPLINEEFFRSQESRAGL